MRLLATRQPLIVWDPPDEDDVDHLWCCDETIALCGLDMSDPSWQDTDDDSPLCVTCAVIDETGMPCPVPGCPGAPPGARNA